MGFKTSTPGISKSVFFLFFTCNKKIHDAFLTIYFMV
jgi:hypothetical protein